MSSSLRLMSRVKRMRLGVQLLHHVVLRMFCCLPVALSRVRRYECRHATATLRGVRAITRESGFEFGPAG